MKKLFGIKLLVYLLFPILTFADTPDEDNVIQPYHAPYVVLNIRQRDGNVSTQDLVISLDDLHDELKDMIIGMKEGEQRTTQISDIIYEVYVIKTDKAKLNYPIQPLQISALR